MSITDMAGVIGMRGLLPVEGGELKIIIRVKDVKKAYGNILYEVEPMNGKGTKWIKADRVHLM